MLHIYICPPTGFFEQSSKNSWVTVFVFFLLCQEDAVFFATRAKHIVWTSNTEVIFTIYNTLEPNYGNGHDISDQSQEREWAS